MAIPINPSMYSGGAVTLDSQPVVNMYAQLLARKQAKNDAIDEYYRKLPSTLNSAGMREQDIQGFNEKLSEWQQHWMKNKEQIRKGTTKEAFDSDKAIRELQMAIQNSKNAAKTDLELGKMRFQKDNEYIFQDPNFMTSQKSHSLPIWDAGHKQMDLGSIAIPPKPFDVKSQNEFWKAATEGLSTGKKYDYSKQYKNEDTGQVIVPFQKNFSVDQVEQIADRAMGLAKSDRSIMNHYEKILNSADKAAFDEFQKYYSKVYSGLADTPEKVAAADAIKRALQPQEVGEEQELNYQQRQDDKRININLNLSKGRGGDDVADYDILRKYEPKAMPVTTKVKVGGNWLNPQYEEKTENRIPAKDIPVQHIDLIKTKPITDPKTNEKYYILKDDGNWEGQNGQVISWQTVAQAELDRVTAQEVRRGRQKLERDNNTPKPKTETVAEKMRRLAGQK